VDNIPADPHPYWKQAEIALIVLLIGYIVMYIRSRKHRKSPAEKPVDRQPDEKPIVAEVPRPVFPFEVAHDTGIAGSELRYFHPFAPNDTIRDVWCKFQTLKSNEPLMVRLGAPEGMPVFQSDFTPDELVHSTGAMFAEEFARGLLRYGWPGISRNVRALASFGVPADTPEGGYFIYAGPLFIELKGVLLSNVPFEIRVTFETNFKLVLKRLSAGADYLHCLAPSGGDDGGMEIGFPLTLSRITLYSDDASLAATLPEFVQRLKTDHQKHHRLDPDCRGHVISDEVVTIVVAEGTTKRTHHQFVQVSYSPAPKGPLDFLTTADVEFVQYAKAASDKFALSSSQNEK
jgi:hypothetical protein